MVQPGGGSSANEVACVDAADANVCLERGVEAEQAGTLMFATGGGWFVAVLAASNLLARAFS